MLVSAVGARGHRIKLYANLLFSLKKYSEGLKLSVTCEHIYERLS